MENRARTITGAARRFPMPGMTVGEASLANEASDAFEPRFEGFAARVRASFGRQRAMALIGATQTLMVMQGKRDDAGTG